jgi:hypothetical protein
VQSDAYDSNDLRLLSAALSAALGVVRNYAGGPLTPTETSDFSTRLAHNLMEVFDCGERDPEALERAALQGVLWATTAELNRARRPASAGLVRTPSVHHSSAARN